MFFCYILECADRSLYVGVAEDPSGTRAAPLISSQRDTCNESEI